MFTGPMAHLSRETEMTTSSPRSHLHLLAKTMSWRAIGAVDTLAVTYFVTGGSIKSAIGVVVAETVTKGVWYYAHEVAWERGISFPSIPLPSFAAVGRVLSFVASIATTVAAFALVGAVTVIH